MSSHLADGGWPTRASTSQQPFWRKASFQGSTDAQAKAAGTVSNGESYLSSSNTPLRDSRKSRKLGTSHANSAGLNKPRRCQLGLARHGVISPLTLTCRARTAGSARPHPSPWPSSTPHRPPPPPQLPPHSPTGRARTPFSAARRGARKAR